MGQNPISSDLNIRRRMVPAGDLARRGAGDVLRQATTLPTSLTAPRERKRAAPPVGPGSLLSATAIYDTGFSYTSDGDYLQLNS